MTDEARHRLRAHHELAARASYGRLLAILAARLGDIASAEDALADAFLAALEQWPTEGVPDNPDGWLVTAAKRRLVSDMRRGEVRERAATVLHLLEEERADAVEGSAGAPPQSFPDERLALLFVCAHPAIDEVVRTPLMLQTVLGLDAIRIASAVRVAPKTMGQRLWRAKTKIKDAHLAFEIPARTDLPERLGAVLEAIYAAYGSGWEDMTGDDPRLKGLTEEALWLSGLVVELLPEEPEAMGLHALLLFAEARRGARRTDAGEYVPLTEQEPARWSSVMIEEAERVLARAGRAGRLGPFQLEAAIQSAHVDSVRTGRADEHAIATLYEGLVRVAPTLGALVGRAAALAPVQGTAAALAALEAIPTDQADSYQPWWAVKAHLASLSGDAASAREAYARAIGLTEDPAIRRFLIARSDALPKR